MKPSPNFRPNTRRPSTCSPVSPAATQDPPPGRSAPPAAGIATSPESWPVIQDTRRASVAGSLIEPFNTTYGVDRDALWLHVGAMLQAQGDAWIGISVRAWSAGELQRHDPARYADIEISSNDLVWDLLRAIGTLVKQGDEHSPLHHLAVRHVYLGGYSQSAVDTATFAAAFGALTRTTDGRPVYDGYFPASHAASLTPVAVGEGLPRFEYAPMPPAGVPVIEVQPQSDVEGFSVRRVRQPRRRIGAPRGQRRRRRSLPAVRSRRGAPCGQDRRL